MKALKNESRKRIISHLPDAEKTILLKRIPYGIFPGKPPKQPLWPGGTFISKSLDIL
jgi:hypothetical protein